MTYRYRLANSIPVLALVVLPFCSSQNFQAQTAKTTPAHPPAVARRLTQTQRRLIRHNEAGALRSLQQLFSAEATYQSTTGNGDYGTLEELEKAGLVDYVLAEGHRYGYLFRIRREKRSSESQPSLEIVAVPRTYGRTGRLSFYIDETGVTRAADKKGAEATLANNSFVIDP